MTREERNRILQMEDAELSAQCHQDFHKSSGRGGQKVNKTSSAVRLFHVNSGLTVNCAESRSQMENRHLALKKLRNAIALAFRCLPEEDAPSLSVIPSERNRLYALWTAEVFDWIAAAHWDLKTAAVELHTTRSQLSRMLENHPEWLRYFRSNAAKQTHSATDPTPKSILEVCAAVILIDGKVLICSRPKHPNEGTCMEFPGGKVEPGETHQACLIREIREELGAEIVVHEQIHVMEHDYGTKYVRVHFYHAELSAGSPDPAPQEHQEICLVEPEMLPSMNLLPADLPLAKMMADKKNPVFSRLFAIKSEQNTFHEQMSDENGWQTP